MTSAVEDTTAGINRARPAHRPRGPDTGPGLGGLWRDQLPRRSPRSVHPCGRPGCCCCSARFRGRSRYLLARRIVARSGCWSGRRTLGAGRFDQRSRSRPRRVAGSAQRLTRMSVELALSQERSERIARLNSVFSPRGRRTRRGSDQEKAALTATVPNVGRDLWRSARLHQLRRPGRTRNRLLWAWCRNITKRSSTSSRVYEATADCFMVTGLAVLNRRFRGPGAGPPLLANGGWRWQAAMQSGFSELSRAGT